jgi:hypothetical protein
MKKWRLPAEVMHGNNSSNNNNNNNNNNKLLLLFYCNTTRCGHDQDIFVEVEIRKFEYKDVQAAEQFFFLLCTKHTCQHNNCLKRLNFAVRLYLICKYFLMSLSVLLILTLFFQKCSCDKYLT